MIYPLILGSASPRRKNILTKLGVSFEIVIPLAEEISYPHNAKQTATENAELKCEWCRKRHIENRILCADTVVDFKNQCIEKPDSMEDAFNLIRKLSGQTHYVHTASVLYDFTGAMRRNITTSTVTFRTMSDAMIHEYFSKFNPLDRAGAYDINEHGDMIVESYAGSFTNIMGLPAETVKPWLTSEQN